MTRRVRVFTSATCEFRRNNKHLVGSVQIHVTNNNKEEKLKGSPYLNILLIHGFQSNPFQNSHMCLTDDSCAGKSINNTESIMMSSAFQIKILF